MKTSSVTKTQNTKFTRDELDPNPNQKKKITPSYIILLSKQTNARYLYILMKDSFRDEELTKEDTF